MQTTELTASELRTRMKARRVTVRALAQAAGMYESNLSSILAGREYLGPDRRARIETGIVRLGLDQDATEPAERLEPVFEIRRKEGTEQ